MSLSQVLLSVTASPGFSSQVLDGIPAVLGESINPDLILCGEDCVTIKLPDLNDQQVGQFVVLHFGEMRGVRVKVRYPGIYPTANLFTR